MLVQIFGHFWPNWGAPSPALILRWFDLYLLSILLDDFLLVPTGCVKMRSASVTHHAPHEKILAMTNEPPLWLQRQRPHYLTQHYRCLHSLRNLVLNDFRNLPRSHHRCERHIHHYNQQHLRCFAPTHCPHRSHWRCLRSSIRLPPRWWITGASDMREAASGIVLMCITVTECHRQWRWRFVVASSNGKQWDHSTTIHSFSNITINHWCFVGWGGEWCPIRGSNGRNDQIKQSTAGDFWLFMCWLLHHVRTFDSITI